MTEIILTKCMSIFLLIGAGIFTLRLRNGFLFFLAIVLSGMLMIYPDTFERAFSYSTIAITLYLIISLILPYIMTRDSRPIMYPSFLLGSLPISALIVSYGLYEV